MRTAHFYRAACFRGLPAARTALQALGERHQAEAFLNLVLHATRRQ